MPSSAGPYDDLGNANDGSWLAARRRKSMAELLAAQAGQGEPVYSIGHGIAKLGAGAIAGYLMKKDDEKEQALNAKGESAMADAIRTFGGGGGAAASPSPSSATGGTPGTFTTGTVNPSDGKQVAGGDVENRFLGSLQSGGLTNPFALATVGAYANHESGYSPKNITGSWSDPSESGAAGTSGGILSWRAERLASMRGATAGASDPVDAQARFFLSENPGLTQALQNSRSLEESNRLMANSWKFAGYDKPGGEFGSRLATSKSYLGKVGGEPGAFAAAAPNQLPGTPRANQADLPMTGSGPAQAMGGLPQTPEGFAIPPAPGSAPAGLSPDNTISIGDSIGQGVGKAAGLTTFATVGHSPAKVLNTIRSMKPDMIAGANVVLSSGASNDPSQVGLVADQIDALKKAGAGRITLLGVGDRPDIASANDALRQVAESSGASFSPIGKTGSDQVHPADYGSVWRNAAGASAPDTQTSVMPPPADAPAPMGGDPAVAPPLPPPRPMDLPSTPPSADAPMPGAQEASLQAGPVQSGAGLATLPGPPLMVANPLGGAGPDAPPARGAAMAQALQQPMPDLSNSNDAGAGAFARGNGNPQALAAAVSNFQPGQGGTSGGASPQALAAALQPPPAAPAARAAPMNVLPPGALGSPQAGPNGPVAAPQQAPPGFLDQVGNGLRQVFGVDQAQAQPAPPQQAPGGLSAQISALANSPNPVHQAMAKTLIERATAPNSYGFHMTPDGTMVRTDPRSGSVSPVYNAPKPPNFGVIGEDEYGNKRYGFVDPSAGKVTPYQGAPGSQPVLPGQPGAAIPAPPPGVDPKVWRQRQSESAATDALPVDPRQVAEMRKEVLSLPSYKNVTQAMPVYRSMADAAGRDTKAADLNLIYGMGKIMDPGSVVREGEMALANGTSGLDERLKGFANSVFGGARLTPETRQALMAEAHGRMRSYEGVFDTDANHYRGIAKRGRMTIEDVVPSFEPSKPWMRPEPSASAPGGRIGPPPGSAGTGPAPVVQPPSVAQPPAAAVKALQGDPSLQAQFDRKYGQGAAARAMGSP